MNGEKGEEKGISSNGHFAEEEEEDFSQRYNANEEVEREREDQCVCLFEGVVCGCTALACLQVWLTNSGL